MTATATTTAPTRIRRPAEFWGKVRAGYAGGLGATFSELATQHRLPATTIRTRAITEGWEKDAQVSELERKIRARAKELMREANDYRADRVQQRLVREFGPDAPVPSLIALRALFPRPGLIDNPRDQSVNVPVNGLKRWCYAKGCGAITTSDPCTVCGTAADQVGAP